MNNDKLVKSPSSRHTGESRYPELSGNTGFRVKHGMTKQGEIDFLRGRQQYARKKPSVIWKRHGHIGIRFNVE